MKNGNEKGEMHLPQTIELKGIRVLTTRQLAEAYGTEIKVIQNNFQRNKDRYVAGKHYIYMDRDELREVKTTHPQFDGELKRASRIHFWTEKGALLHAKSLNTDKAWEVYDYLVDFYFRAKEPEKSESPEPVDTVENRTKRRMVVDVPENKEIQSAMQEIRKYLCAIDVTLQEGNAYCCEERYAHVMGILDILWISLGKKILDARTIEPNLIPKSY